MHLLKNIWTVNLKIHHLTTWKKQFCTSTHFGNENAV